MPEVEPCPFCAIQRERLIFEHDLFYALWDGFPVSPGHTLLIPRRHVPTWFEATREERSAIIEGIEKAREEILRRYHPDGFNIGMNVGAAGGQTIFHLHVHVIPRYSGDQPDPRGGVRNVIPSKGNYLRPQPSGIQFTGAIPHNGALITGAEDPLLPHLLAHLDRAAGADICVAFVQLSGLHLVQEHMRDLLNRGGRLRFLTGDYMDITDPQALLELLDLDGNIDLRVFETTKLSFHPKSYIFHFDDGKSVALVGSSNLTGSALKTGIEWNYRVVTSDDAKGLIEIEKAFDNLFLHPSTTRVDDAWVKSYVARRKPPAHKTDVKVEAAEPPPPPHAIQKEALAALVATRAAGNGAGLVVLVTGLGKTWLSAYDSDRPGFDRVLFVAHREEILSQARATFRRIRPQARLGLYNGTEKLPDADVLFASIQTLGKQTRLREFDKKRFDYIIVDEFHHAAARTYRNLIGHFTPKFLLGLTATPERTDGGDLLSLCQENLVYRCDLVEGIKQGLLVPFHYFGVPDEVDYRNIPWRNNRFDEEELTKAVATQKRAQNALEQYNIRGGDRTLAFCCSQKHSDFMADYFCQKGLRAVAVHSGETTAPRAASLEALEAGNIDVIFAVDMFNEGVDLPNVDTVMMLRPTESSILWMQQFGRGLRKAPGKSHLTVIDYIGNHRIFLNKPRTLLGLAASDYEIDRALNLLIKDDYELPPGCEVTYDLAAVDIIRSLLKRAAGADAVRAFYEDFRERHGQRPTASELLHEGFNPAALRGRYGSWLQFVKAMGDLTPAQLQAISAAGEFLDQIETTQMTKSFKMLTLLAMLNEDKFPGAIDINPLADGFEELAGRSATLRRDVGPALGNKQQLIQLLEQNPINAWVGGKGTGGQQFFTYEKGAFASRIQLPQPLRDPFQELTREIADWRLSAYLTRSEINQAAGQGFSCKVITHSGGKPILILPDRKNHPQVPTGSVPVDADGRQMEADFVKIAVNVVHEAGKTENLLPTILYTWFGPDAGKPGTNSHVTFEPAESGYTMRPAKRNGPTPGALELWRSYMREEIPPLFGLEFNTATWNVGFLTSGRNIFLLVTLDKGDLLNEHRYEDRFTAPDAFQWQSQNRTTQNSTHGQMLRLHKEKGITVHLFVRRSKKAASRSVPFTYCGPVEFQSWAGDQPITVQWRLSQPVPERLHSLLKVPPAASA